MSKDIKYWQEEAIDLLKALIATPSLSKEEDNTALIIKSYLEKNDVKAHRVGNNVFAFNKYYNSDLPTILLNSHHDTVKPNSKYSKDPFEALVEGDKLFGLGSNDAGGCLVSLIATFLHFYKRKGMLYNICIAATAEEEISGRGGIEFLLSQEKEVFPFRGSGSDFAIVGEPTLMKMAIAERGLMVIDFRAHGITGHAARNEGESALLKAVDDINWIRNYQFDRVSDFMGPVKMTPTVISTVNKAHNVVPSTCSFVVDVRVNELYSFEEILETLSDNIKSEFKPRSKRLRSSRIDMDHPIVKSGLILGKDYYGSPTMSDMALMSFPALKIGPGDSARSHSADEYVYLTEIVEGIVGYIKLIQGVVQ